MNKTEPKDLKRESIADLKSELLTLADKLAFDYQPRQLPSHDYAGPENPPPDIFHSEKVFAKERLESLPDFDFTLFEIGGVSSMITREIKQWALWAKLEHKGDLVSEGFLLHSNQDRWNFSHRLTPEQFRGQGFFETIRGFLETFVQTRANIARREQTIFLSAGQPDVIKQFSKWGYITPDLVNAERLQRILTPNNGLILRQALKPKVFSGGQAYEPTKSEYSSPYYFDENHLAEMGEISQYKIEHAFRVELQKKVYQIARSDLVTITGNCCRLANLVIF